MTLLINEIHAFDSLQNSLILHIADRRITINGKFHSNRKKIFQIPYLNAGVGYFGLAQVNAKGFFSDWLPNFINKNSDVQTLGHFAERLKDGLNQAVDKKLLSTIVSGFHLCGYNQKRPPEFWIVRNSKVFDENLGIYQELKTEYYCDEEFLKRGAIVMGFNTLTTLVPGHRCQYYLNGDVRPFHHIWQPLDEFLAGMFSGENFRAPTTIAELEKAARWKLEVIASFYQRFARKKIIGTPIDAFILLPQ
jgi:hypothetical protein